MATMYKKLRKVKEYPRSAGALFEPTVRLPYALHAPAIVTHIPLFNMSQEDFNFEAQTQRLLLFFELRRDQFDTFGLTSDDKNEIRALFFKAAINDDPPRYAEGMQDVIKEAWQAAETSFEKIIKMHPEYILFRSISLISRDINHDAHASVVDRIRKSRSSEFPEVWRGEFVLHHAFHLVNATLQVFLGRVDDFIKLFEKDHSPSSLARHAATKQDILGGFVSWMDAHEFPNTNQTGKSRRAFFMAGDKHAPETGGFKTVVDEYLVWRRGEQNWRYTFYEGIYEFPDETAADRLSGFLGRFLASASLEDSFPSKGRLADELKDDATDQYSLPGKRIGGAQYFIVPIGLLLVLMARFDDVRDTVKPKPALKFDADLRTADRRDLQKCIDAILDVGENLAKKEMADFSNHLRNQPLTSPADVIRMVERAARWLKVVVERLDAKSVHHPHFFSAFAGLTELCWKLIYADAGQSYGHDDFVCSRVIDNRALYFSNFRPIDKADAGRECDFTRTFFIDCGLTDYQRARLARRLCEVATYRMSCIKDISRIRAMQDGLDELNIEFGTLVTETAKATTPKSFSTPMTLATDLYQRMLDFDLFISEGVLGRRLSAEAEWARVRKQVTDIREKRVAGYATLTDFLERGLAATVSDIVRFAGRYENLRNRVRDHLSSIRTRISVSNSTAIVNMLEANQALAKDSEQLLRSVKEEMVQNKALANNSMLLLQKVGDWGEKQTAFLSSADTLIFIGAVYYVATWLHQLLRAGGHTVSVGWWGVAEELAIVVAVVILVAVVRIYLDALKAKLKSVWCRLRRIFRRLLRIRKQK
jgi:hypothetical protein